jgi:hypothetical protein
MTMSRRLLLLLAVLLLAPVPCLVSATGRNPEIEALIEQVAQAQDIVFIRNGSAHSAAEAAAHLRRKLAAADGRITTAEQFIDVLGTRSSMTGKAYRVRLADGREIDSATWLRQLLRELRARTPRVSTPPPAAARAHWPVRAGR